jgi:hypothetical protein
MSDSDSDSYSDRWIECTSEGIGIRGYYFPWGTKHIPYAAIRSMRRVELSGLRGRGRIWGTANPRYWASLDPRRSSKRVGLILDLGRFVAPLITPEDPNGFEAAVQAHSQIGATGASRPAPLI